jgi:hypothetical protein
MLAPSSGPGPSLPARTAPSRTTLPSRTAAPLDETIYLEGDISKAPALPHDLGLTRLQHADSSLLLGRVPGNVTQKDFIRRGQTLRPMNVVEMAQRVRSHDRREAKLQRNRFNAHTYDATMQLEREIQRLKNEEARQADWERQLAENDAAIERGYFGNPGTRSGAAATGAAGEDREAREANIPRHPETIPESEAVRGNVAASTSAVARRLARRAGAPLIVGPEPAHHFYAGGSSSQLRKERRRQVERQRLREANLELRKQQLVDRNLEVLEDIGQQEDVNRRLAQEFHSQLEASMPPPVPMELDLAHAHAHAPAATPRTASAPAPASTSATSTHRAVAILGAAVAVAAFLVLAAAVIRRKRR